MAINRGTPEGNFEIEIDGIPAFRALRVSGGVEKNNLVKIGEGNSPFQHNVRNTSEADDLTIEVAIGRYETAMNAIRQWRRDFRDGISFRKNARRIVFDETGRTPLHTTEYLECTPVSISTNDQSARGDGPATVTIILSPERVED